MAERRPGSVAVHVQIADDLRSAITAGDYSDGDRLPGENQLMSRYGVARMTARQALATLRNEGLAVARRGSGVYVRLFTPIRRHGSRRLSQSGWGAGADIHRTEATGRSVAVDRLVVDRVRPDDDVRRALGLTPNDDVVRRTRRYLVDGRPVQHAVSYLPWELAEGTPIAQDDTGPGGVFARLAEQGEAPVSFSETLSARMPTPDEANLLELPAGTPVVHIIRSAMTATARTVDLTHMVLDASCHLLQYDFDA